MSLRIAIVGACPYPVPQGSQIFLRDHAIALRNLGHDVRLVVYGYGSGEDATDLELVRCPRVYIGERIAAGPSFPKPLLDFLLMLTLRYTVYSQKIDIVFAHNYEALLAALPVSPCPVVYCAHNAMSDELPYYFRGAKWAERFGRWLDRVFPKRAARIVAPHRRLAGHLIVRGCDHSKIAVVPPPVDTAQFAPCRHEQGFPPVLYAGNLDTYQNLDLLYAAMDWVRRTRPEARLLIATATPAEIPGAEVVIANDLESLSNVLSRDAVFAVPRVSWSGYPIKLLNAMAAGQAIVACASAAYPITHDQNGLVVADNDVEGFGAALLRLLEDSRLRATLGTAARKTIEAEYRFDDVGRQLEELAYRALDLPLPDRDAKPKAL